MGKRFPRSDLVIDVACVIHSDGYSWQYVQQLDWMLGRAFEHGHRLHVYTEHDRSVPPHMIKHVLQEWPGIGGRKRSWWYKLQVFNREHFQGPLLYLDLDVVIVRSLDWIRTCSLDYFWSCRDFRYLQRPNLQAINSSVMWFDTERFDWVWQDFQKQDINQMVKQYPGDQDYLQRAIDHNRRRFFQDEYFQSYRWQVKGGGYDFQRRHHRRPDVEDTIAPDCSVVVFHGLPKPHQVPGTIRHLWHG